MESKKKNKEIILKFFVAGNFMFFAKVKREKRFWKEAQKRYGDNFMRLTSFYFKKPTKNALEVQKRMKKK